MRAQPGVTDQNGHDYLDGLRLRIMQHLTNVTAAPSVPFYERPPDAMQEGDLEDTGGAFSGRGRDGDSPRSPGGRQPMRLWSGDTEGAAGGERARANLSYADRRIDGELVSSLLGQSMQGGGSVRPSRPAMLRPPWDGKSGGNGGSG